VNDIHRIETRQVISFQRSEHMVYGLSGSQRRRQVLSFCEISDVLCESCVLFLTVIVTKTRVLFLHGFSDYSIDESEVSIDNFRSEMRGEEREAI